MKIVSFFFFYFVIYTYIFVNIYVLRRTQCSRARVVYTYKWQADAPRLTIADISIEMRLIMHACMYIHGFASYRSELGPTAGPKTQK